MRGEDQNKYKKTGDGRIELDGDFSLIVAQNLWKQVMKDDDDQVLHNHIHVLFFVINKIFP